MKSNFLGLGGVGNQIQTAIYISNDKKYSGYIDEIHFKLEKFRNTTYLLRIRVYNKNKRTQLPDEDLLLSDNILSGNQFKKDNIFSIRSKSIELPEDGFFVSFEWLPQPGITQVSEPAPYIVGSMNAERNYMYTNYREIKWYAQLQPIMNNAFSILNIEANISY
jgi:hypothetical protein